MSDDELKIVALTAIKSLINGQKINAPITSLDLLTSVITTKLPIGLLPRSPPPRFRLTDLRRFERIVEDLANTWSEGFISFSNDSSSGKMKIWEIGLHSAQGQAGRSVISVYGNSASVGGIGNVEILSKKRKRVVDEDADSAAGDEDEALLEEEGTGVAGSTLANLTPEMREVYTIIQKSTAKGKLLAEQVRFLHSWYTRRSADLHTIPLPSSFVLETRTSNPFVSISPRMNALKPDEQHTTTNEQLHRLGVHNPQVSFAIAFISDLLFDHTQTSH